MLRMKNFNILGFTDFGGCTVTKNQYRKGGALKGGLGQFPNFRGDSWQETLKSGVGVQPTMAIQETLKYWVGVQQGQSYIMGRRCLFSLG